MNHPQFHQPGHIFLLSLYFCWICVSKCSAKDDGKSWANGNYTSHPPHFLIPDDRVGATSIWNPHTAGHWQWDTRCSKVFGVDDGDVRELLASGHAALANNTLWGSSILMHNLFLYCGGMAWVVLTPHPPTHPMDVADEEFSKAGATRPMCLWWSVLPPCNSTDQHISGLRSIRRSS